MDSYKIGKYIYQLRKEKNITQEELAERIGVNSKTISKWEVGTNIPDTNSLYELSKEFNVTTQEILNGGEIHNNTENNNSIKNGINFYMMSIKKKIMFISLLVIIFIISGFSILYTISNFNRNRVYDVYQADDVKDFFVSGYAIFNRKETIVIINDLIYQNENKGFDDEPVIKKCSLLVKDKNDKIHSLNELSFDSLSKISSILETQKIEFVNQNDDIDNISINNFNGMYIDIVCDDETNTKIEYKINLEIKNHFSNNKIFY